MNCHISTKKSSLPRDYMLDLARIFETEGSFLYDISTSLYRKLLPDFVTLFQRYRHLRHYGPVLSYRPGFLERSLLMYKYCMSVVAKPVRKKNELSFPKKLYWIFL